MKTQYLQTKALIKPLKIFCVFLICLLTASGLALSVGATDSSEDYIVENYNMIEEYSSSLSEEINSYADLDTSTTSDISKNVANLINIYRKELLDLQSHTDVSTRSLAKEIKLSHAKGQAIGRVGWIYYHGLTSLESEESTDTISEKFSSITDEIDASADSAVLSARSDAICTEMNKAVYTERIRALALPDDSLYSKSLIAGAIDDLENVDSPDLFGESFAKILEEVTHSLSLQRCRDGLTEQMRHIYSLIGAEGEFTANETVALLTYKLQNASDISAMNSAMRDALYDLIKVPEENSYAFILANELCAEAGSVASAASAKELMGEFTPIFDGYALKRQKANAKDSVAALLSGIGIKEERESIELLFNGDGGRIDKCVNKKEIDSELVRAEYMAELCLALENSENKLSVVLGSYDRSTFSKRLYERYEIARTELEVLSTEIADLKEACSVVISEASSALEQILDEAKAERFLLDHKEIIKKPYEELSAKDELSLRTSLTAYISLEPDTQAALASQAASIAEKYKTVLVLKIRELKKNDAFYLELCEPICSKIKLEPTNDIDVFYNNCEILIQSSQTVFEIAAYLRSITSEALYESFTSVEKDQLASVCKNAVQQICSLDKDGTKSPDEFLDYVLNNTKLSMCRIREYARARIAARGSEEVDIQKILSELKAELEKCSGITELPLLTDASIFKLQRLLTAYEMIARSDAEEYTINSMKFLTEDEKIIFSGKIKNIKASLASQARLSENITVLSFIWDSFTEELTSIASDANLKDLERGRENYSTLASKELSAISADLRGMSYLPSARQEEIVSSCASVVSSFKTALAACASSNDAEKLYAGLCEQLESIRLSASGEELAEYKKEVSASLDGLKGEKSNYSVENYNKLLAIIEQSKKTLDACGSISECTALFERAAADVGEVNDLLDDAKDGAAKALGQIYENCKDSAHLYSAKSLERIESLYKSALEKIYAFESMSRISELNSLLSESLLAIKQVNKDRAYTSDNAERITQSGARYPQGYDFSKGFLGSVYSPSGIISDARLSIKPIDGGSDLAKLQRIIRKAARKDSLITLTSRSLAQQKLLQKCVISHALDIQLSEEADGISKYTLQLLLPTDMLEENVLGIVFITEDGEVEFYGAEQKELLLSVNLSHFSKYYIVSENTTNLVPLIIFLIIFLIFELVTLAFVLFLRQTRRRKENRNMLPDSFVNSFAPFAFALRIKPEGGVGLALLLSIAALALGCGIAILAKAELRALKEQKSPVPDKDREKNDGEQARLEARRSTHLLAEPVLCTVAADIPSDDNASEDIQAFVYEPAEDAPEEDGEADPAFALHRAEINLDVIADKFRYGELVTLDALKQKRLVSKRTDYVKILARGSLTKPLVIEAHDFSRAAEEMLKAVGGEAIRIK